MKINILAVGKLKEQFLRDAIDEYSKRLSKFTRLEIIEVDDSKTAAKSASDIDRIKTQEAAKLSSKVKGHLICLDIRGETLTSDELANYIDNNMSNGVSEFTFLIGGSHGIAHDILDMADKRLSFGKMTYPHQLMRVILIEQIYRSFMINNNQEYHK